MFINKDEIKVTVFYTTLDKLINGIILDLTKNHCKLSIQFETWRKYII
jgi:hypothetical protein